VPQFQRPTRSHILALQQEQEADLSFDESIEQFLRELSSSTHSVFSANQQQRRLEAPNSSLVARRRRTPEVQDLLASGAIARSGRRTTPEFDFSRINLRQIFGDGPIPISFRFSEMPSTRLSVLPQILDEQEENGQALVSSTERRRTSTTPNVLTVVFSSEKATVATQIDLPRLVDLDNSGHGINPSTVALTLHQSLTPPGFTRIPIVEVDSDDEEEVPASPTTTVLRSQEPQRLLVQDDEEEIDALLTSVFTGGALQQFEEEEVQRSEKQRERVVPPTKTVVPPKSSLSHSLQPDSFEEDDSEFDVRSLPLPERHYYHSASPSPRYRVQEEDNYSVRSYATTDGRKKKHSTSLHSVNMSVIQRNAERQKQRSSNKGLAGVVDSIIQKRTDKDHK